MDYDLATRIIQAFHMTVDPVFMPRMAEALKKTASKTIITTTISDMRKHPKESPEYQSAHAYLSSLDRKATEALIALLEEENDREARMFLLELLKDFGKNQISLIGEHIGDERWYVVRNMVSILGDSKTDQSIAFLRKAADHKDVRIRQEVIKGLVSIGGKKAASVLTKFLRDKEVELQMTAIHALADFPGISAEESKPLIEFLEDRPLKKKEQKLTLEAIKALGKIGGRDAAEFLKRYIGIRWWKPRQLQQELRASALWSIEAINKRRQGDAGRAKR
jgi:HEAT repeat protein